MPKLKGSERSADPKRPRSPRATLSTLTPVRLRSVISPNPGPARGAPPADAPVLQPYLSIAELAQLTPWTDQAIRTIISRHVFQEGHHFFVGRRPVFKWGAMVGFIEQGPPRDRVPHRRDQMKL